MTQALYAHMNNKRKKMEKKKKRTTVKTSDQLKIQWNNIKKKFPVLK
jgi:hypothetical protein